MRGGASIDVRSMPNLPVKSSYRYAFRDPKVRVGTKGRHAIQCERVVLSISV